MSIMRLPGKSIRQLLNSKTSKALAINMKCGYGYDRWLWLFNRILDKYRLERCLTNPYLYYYFSPQDRSVVYHSQTSLIHINQLMMPAVVFNRHRHFHEKYQAADLQESMIFLRHAKTEISDLPHGADRSYRLKKMGMIQRNTTPGALHLLCGPGEGLSQEIENAPHNAEPERKAFFHTTHINHLNKNVLVDAKHSENFHETQSIAHLPEANDSQTLKIQTGAEQPGFYQPIHHYSGNSTERIYRSTHRYQNDSAVQAHRSTRCYPNDSTHQTYIGKRYLTSKTKFDDTAQSHFMCLTPSGLPPAALHVLNPDIAQKDTQKSPESRSHTNHYFYPPSPAPASSDRTGHDAETGGKLIHFTQKGPNGSETTRNISMKKDSKPDSAPEPAVPKIPFRVKSSRADSCRMNVPVIADQVYEMIAERVRREILLRGY